MANVVNSMKLGDTEAIIDNGVNVGEWVEITVDGHHGFGRLVWRMEGDTRSPECEEKVRRIIACYNACEGSSTEWLEFRNNDDAVDQFGPFDSFQTTQSKLLKQMVGILEERDRFLAELKKTVAIWSKTIPSDSVIPLNLAVESIMKSVIKTAA